MSKELFWTAALFKGFLISSVIFALSGQPDRAEGFAVATLFMAGSVYSFYRRDKAGSNPPPTSYVGCLFRFF